MNIFILSQARSM